jgi:hypothetical protein
MFSKIIKLAIGISLISTSTLMADQPNRIRKPDLADLVAGVYFGNVISDSRGSSKAQVTLHVRKQGSNRVLVTSDYPRLGSVLVNLEASAHNMILARGSQSVFLYDPNKNPIRLDYSPDHTVSYSGEKQ